MKVRILLTALIAALLLIGVMVGYAAAQGPITVTEPEEGAAVEAAAPQAGIEGVSWRYEFSSTILTYTPIISGTVHGTASNDDQSFPAIDLGFTFYYDNVPYTQVSIQSNGWIAMGPTIASSYYPLSTGTTNNVISALGRDLQGNGTTSELRSETIGTAPNRVFVVQWTDYKRYGSAYSGDAFDFQIRLYETSNLIEIVYGEFTVIYVASPPYGPQVGLRGPSNADFHNRRTDATHFWADSLRGTTNADSMSLTDTIYPPNGLTYRWSLFTGVVLDPPEQSGSDCAGSDVVYNWDVYNTTGTTQTFNLDYDSVWPASGPGATGPIPHNGYETITVTVHVPWAANAGDSDLLTITAADPTQTYTGTATATTVAGLASGWDDYANIPAGREVRAPSVVYYDGKLYVIGGYNVSAQPWVSIYDIAGDSWSTGADMPAGRYWIDCEQLFDPNDNNRPKIYCAGGYLSSAQNTLYIYDIISDTWTIGPTLPANRYNYASAKLDNKYYVIGGYTTAYEPTMLVYDPATNAWDSSLASMNVARRYFHAGVIGGQIYVAGGYNGSYLSSAEVYSPTANAWTYVASMPTPWLNGADGVKHDRYLVIAGGSPSSTAGASNGALVYDALTDTWNWLPLLDHLIYGAEGDIDGNGEFWYATGRLYEGGVWSYSPYTTKMVQCAECVPAYGADFTVNPPVPRPGLPATFSGSVAGGSPPIAWTWDFGDNTTGSGQVVQHTYATTGTFTVVMTATNCDGANWVTATHDVQVMSGPMIAVDPPALESTQCPDSLVTQTLSICNEGDQTLVFTITEVLTDILWLSENPTTGTVSPGGCQSVTVTFDSAAMAPGTYTGTLRIDNNDILNPVVNVPVTLTVAGPPTNADFTWEPTPVLLNTPVTFHGSADALVPVDYTWAFGDNNYGSGQDPSHTYTSWGDFTVVMTATACGGFDVVTHTVTVLPCWSVVEEQFEGAFPPANWTVLNNGGTCVWQRNDYWATPRPNYAGGQGFCADADSDKCGSGTTMDTELRTMVLDLTGLTTATLRYMAAYNDIGAGGDYADTDISADGGATWTNLLRWDEDHSAYGPGEQVTLDLTPYAGQNDVIVSFHYYTATYDWWWEVDQVSVFGCYVPGAVPDIAVTPISLTQVLNPDQTAQQTFNIANEGLAALDWTIDEGCGTPVGWLSEDPISGTLPAYNNTDVAVTFDSTGLTLGTYQTTLCVDSNDPDEPTVPVTVTLIVTGTPDIAVSPEALAATLCPSETQVLTLTICNQGDAALVWELQESEGRTGLTGWQPQPFVPVAIGSPDDAADLVTDLEAAVSPAPEGPVPLWAGPEAVLWDNGPLTTHPLACAGGTQDASRLQTSLGMNTLGFGHQFSYGYRMSDDFTVTDPGGWNIDTITFFAYQTGAPSSPSPITGVYLQIWDGPPWAGGSVIWGDLVTNRLLSSTFSGIQRDSETSPCANNRYIFANVAGVGIFLPPGQYWLDWMTDGNPSYSGPWAPPITILGQTTTGDAYQYTTAWNPALDSGISTQQGMPFIIEGTLAFVDIPWLSEDPTGGLVLPGQCQEVAVTFTAPITPGDYAASLLINSNDPDEPEVTVPVTMTVLEPANNADFTWAPPSPLVGEMVVFTATASGAEPLTYAWAFGDGDYGSGANPTHVYTEAGTYTVLLTVTNDCGEAYATHDIMVVEGCVEPSGADFAWTPITPTVGELVYFTGTVEAGTGPFTYTWAFGDGAHGSGQTTSHTYDAAGDYTVVMTVSNACGQDTTTYVVHVVAACEPVTGVEFTWSPITPTVSLMALFTATVEAGTPPFTYTWDFGDGTGSVVLTTPTAIHAYTEAGTYTVTLMVENACGQAGAEHSLTVEALPPVLHYYYLPIITKGF